MYLNSGAQCVCNETAIPTGPLSKTHKHNNLRGSCGHRKFRNSVAGMPPSCQIFYLGILPILSLLHLMPLQRSRNMAAAQKTQLHEPDAVEDPPPSCIH